MLTAVHNSVTPLHQVHVFPQSSELFLFFFLSYYNLNHFYGEQYDVAPPFSRYFKLQHAHISFDIADQNNHVISFIWDLHLFGYVAQCEALLMECSLLVVSRKAFYRLKKNRKTFIIRSHDALRHSFAGALLPCCQWSPHGKWTPLCHASIINKLESVLDVAQNHTRTLAENFMLRDSSASRHFATNYFPSEAPWRWLCMCDEVDAPADSPG